jgi:predicted DNA-binding transcriptional regulator AlpA
VSAEVIRFPTERRQLPRLLSIVELSAHLGMSQRWIRYRCAEGMPVRKYGNRLRFVKTDVDTWLERRYQHG